MGDRSRSPYSDAVTVRQHATTEAGAIRRNHDQRVRGRGHTFTTSIVRATERHADVRRPLGGTSANASADTRGPPRRTARPTPSQHRDKGGDHSRAGARLAEPSAEPSSRVVRPGRFRQQVTADGLGDRARDGATINASADAVTFMTSIERATERQQRPTRAVRRHARPQRTPLEAGPAEAIG